MLLAESWVSTPPTPPGLSPSVTGLFLTGPVPNPNPNPVPVGFKGTEVLDAALPGALLGLSLSWEAGSRALALGGGELAEVSRCWLRAWGLVRPVAGSVVPGHT